jgi:hypothetical protein
MNSDERYIEKWNWDGGHYVCTGLAAGPFPDFAAAIQEIRLRRRRRESDAGLTEGTEGRVPLYFVCRQDMAEQPGTVLGKERVE